MCTMHGFVCKVFKRSIVKKGYIQLYTFFYQLYITNKKNVFLFGYLSKLN